MRRTTLLMGAALLLGCATPGSTPRELGSGDMRVEASSGERELLPDEQILHVLNRLAYGPRPGDVAAVRAMGVDKWIARQLRPESIDDQAAQRAVAGWSTLTMETGELVRGYQATQAARNQAQRQLARMGDSASQRDVRQALAIMDPKLAESQQVIGRIVPELQAATLTRAVASDRQLNEVMVAFWHNHFSVFANKGQQERLFLPEYDRDVIRPNAMGRFRTLLGAVAHSPAMLFYLDNWQSQADSLHPTLMDIRNAARGGRGPAGGMRLGRGGALAIAGSLSLPVRRLLDSLPPAQRERVLLALVDRLNSNPQRGRRGLNENYARELMELHTLGVDGGYTQQDVVEVARALTGWSIALAQQGQFIFRPEQHDAAEKTVLGHRLAPNRGEEDGEQVLDIVARHPATARFITTKLARHFIADEPPKSVVDRCAATFTRTDGDIRETLACVITGPEFFSRAAYRAKVKTPFQVVASALRAVNSQPDGTPRVQQAVAQLGQPIFGRQTPDGWPDRGDAWMNTGAILGRINFGLMLAGGRVPGVSLGRVPELESLRRASREEQVDGVVKLLFGGQVSPDTRQVLLSGENPLLSTLSADTTGMNGGMGGMGGQMDQRRPLPLRGQLRPNNQQIALEGLSQVIGLALGAPEFQRR